MPPKAPADRPPTSRLPKFEPPDHRACNSLTPFRCPHAVHPCPSVDSGLSVQDSTNVDPVTDSGESHWRPLNTSPPNASATERGVVRLATDAGDETDATGVITPAGLASLGYRRVTVSDSAPTSSDGGDGDVWLEY